MAKKTKEEILTIHEALDNLSTIAEINLDDPYRIGIVKTNKLVIQDEEHDFESISWLTPESGQDILDNIKLTFISVLEYLKELYLGNQTDWEDPKTKKGLQAMMVLAGEAANKLDQLTAKIDAQAKPDAVSESKEYRKLQDFYLEEIQHRLGEPLEGDLPWSEEWEKNKDAHFFDTDKKGIKDFETIRRDQEYELFYIRDDENKPFFNLSMIRNIKLVCDFDESADTPFEDDPLLRVVTMKDRDVQGAASLILHAMEPQIKAFHDQKLRKKQSTLIRSISFAVFALMLASDSRNLTQNTLGKSCLSYFSDFQHYLRLAMTSAEYQKLIAYPPEPSDKVSHLLLNFVHELCRQFYMRESTVKQEMTGYIHRLSRKGEEIKKSEHKSIFHSSSIWNQFLENDEHIRTLLKCYPNGPLFKILDVMRLKSDEKISFEPIMQENYPSHLYDLQLNGKTLQIIRMAGPTRQSRISKADISEEFLGMLRSFNTKKNPQKHLLINLQDRTSWKDHIRASQVENLERKAEYSKHLDVLSLNKDTDFYYQTDFYLTVNKATDFIKSCEEQVKSPDECGFYLPAKIEKKKILDFTKKALKMIHQVFFQGKKELVRRERIDFIEIFYLFLTLKIAELSGANSISFSCKDAVDTGSAMSAAFFAFAKFLSEDEINEKDKEFLRWLIYSPAIYVRERSIDSARLTRMLTSLAHMEKVLKDGSKELQKELKPLFDKETLSKLKVKHT